MYSLIVTLIVIYTSFVDKVKTAPLDPNALKPDIEFAVQQTQLPASMPLSESIQDVNDPTAPQNLNAEMINNTNATEDDDLKADASYYYGFGAYRPSYYGNHHQYYNPYYNYNRGYYGNYYRRPNPYYYYQQQPYYNYRPNYYNNFGGYYNHPYQYDRGYY